MSIQNELVFFTLPFFVPNLDSMLLPEWQRKKWFFFTTNLRVPLIKMYLIISSVKGKPLQRIPQIKRFLRRILYSGQLPFIQIQNLKVA